MTAVFDFFCLNRKFLVYNLVLRNLKLRYRKSTFGFLWTILAPAASACVYYFVFKSIIKIQVDNYLFFLFSGLIPWTFFSGSIVNGTESLVNNFSILNKVPMNICALPLAEVIAMFVNFALSFPVLVAIALMYGFWPGFHWLALIPVFAALFLQTYAIAMILSISYVYLRDLRHVVGILIQVWLYLTPVFYNDELVPEAYRPFLLLNPVFGIFRSIHKILLQQTLPSPDDLGLISLWTAALLVVAAMFYSFIKQDLVERI
jgi:lipopolysaccharide transport system permease protein